MKRAFFLLAGVALAAPALGSPGLAQDGDPSLSRSGAAAKPVAKPKPAKPTATAAQQTPQPSAAQAPPPAQNQQPPAANATMAPVEQAQKAGVTTCMPLLQELSALTIDAAHSTLSTWNKDAPGQRGYSALTTMQYNNAVAPNAIALEIVTPSQANKCDGGFLRVHPSKLSCAEISQGLAKDKNMPAPDKMNAAVLVYPPNSTGQRLVLMDAPNSGCVVISNAFYFTQ